MQLLRCSCINRSPLQMSSDRNRQQHTQRNVTKEISSTFFFLVKGSRRTLKWQKQETLLFVAAAKVHAQQFWQTVFHIQKGSFRFSTQGSSNFHSCYSEWKDSHAATTEQAYLSVHITHVKDFLLLIFFSLNCLNLMFQSLEKL